MNNPKLKEPLSCFKAYDVRGILGSELNSDIAYRIGRSVAHTLNANKIVLGFDSRETSPELAKAVIGGISDSGSDTFQIGLAGTEEVYSAVVELNADAGIEITASHNPINYNGLKIVKFDSQPLTNKEFQQIKYLAEKNKFKKPRKKGLVVNKKLEARDKYIEKLISFVDVDRLQPLKIVVNSGNGVAGPVIDAIDRKLLDCGLTTNFVRVHHNPDKSFPNGIPNPLLKKNRSATAEVVKYENADFGVTFDGDFDRCFLFDDGGNFIPGEYIVGLLAEVFSLRQSKPSIVHDTRVIWNTLDIVKKFNGRAFMSKTGHAFIKGKMREVDAIYGGEMSAHHYFRDFYYCDSGMVPWLVIWQLISDKNSSLSKLVSERRYRFPSSGEINFKVPNASRCIDAVKSLFCADASKIDELDGLSAYFEDWRFNLRPSNTEPLVRLNIETKANQKLLKTKIDKLSEFIKRL